MTPQERAKDLYDKFYPYQYDADAAKQCALIAVDEILIELSEWGEVWMKIRINYWQEVKTEIQKL